MRCSTPRSPESTARHERGDGAMTVSIILGVAGMSIGRHINKDFIWLVKAIAAHDQSHYPERMGVTFIINAPTSVFGTDLPKKLVLGAREAVHRPRDARQDQDRHGARRGDWRVEVSAALGDGVVERVEGGVDVGWRPGPSHVGAPAAVAASLCAAVVGRAWTNLDGSRRRAAGGRSSARRSEDAHAPAPARAQPVVGRDRRALARPTRRSSRRRRTPRPASRRRSCPSRSPTTIKLEQMETGDATRASEVSEEASAPKKPSGPSAGLRSWPSRRCWRVCRRRPVSAGVLLAEDAGAFTGTAHAGGGGPRAAADGAGPPRGLPARRRRVHYVHAPPARARHCWRSVFCRWRL